MPEPSNIAGWHLQFLSETARAAGMFSYRRIGTSRQVQHLDDFSHGHHESPEFSKQPDRDPSKLWTRAERAQGMLAE